MTGTEIPTVAATSVRVTGGILRISSMKPDDGAGWFRDIL